MNIFSTIVFDQNATMLIEFQDGHPLTIPTDQIRNITFPMSNIYTAVFLTLLAIGSSIGQAHACGWKDSMDPAAPSNDPGRGLSDWKIHYEYITVHSGSTNGDTLVADRMQTLSSCLSIDVYAKLYADLSVLIAGVGDNQAGWKNAMDSSAPSQDPGRGLMNWQIHYKHGLGSGRSNVYRLIGVRLSTLKQALSIEAYAKLYADASVLVAKYGRA